MSDDIHPASDRQPTCADRIQQHYDSRERHIHMLLSAALAEAVTDVPDNVRTELESLGVDLTNDETLSESSRTRLDELPLAISIRHTLRVDLSTGGPGDWFEVDIEPVNHGWQTCGNVVYHFADWFDHAAMETDGHGSLDDWADQLVEYLPEESS